MSQVSLLHEDCCDILWKVENLTFKAPVTTTADNNFFFFSEKTSLDISSR